MSGLLAPPVGPEIIRPEEMPLVVGRGATADVRLLHPAVSRRHAVLEFSAGVLRVRTLGGRSGLRVNGQLVEERSLRDADRVDFGPVAYLVIGHHLRLLARPEGVRLETHGLTVVRGGVTLLTEVNLSIGPGQFVGLLGPSGAGKTSLLKCLAGFYPPGEGCIKVDGVDLFALGERGLTQAGYVPQEEVLYLRLTARENLDLSLRLRTGNELTAVERAEVVAGVLERVRLGKQGDLPAGVLSGGQRRRLNVAVELLTRPRILFLDEPTTGLDPAAELRIMLLLQDLASRGVTVVCSTHVLTSLELFNQVVIVAGGTLAYAGPPGGVLGNFRVQSFPALYESLDRHQSQCAGKISASTPNPGSLSMPPSALSARGTVTRTLLAPRIGLGAQVVAQFLRGGLLIVRDRGLRVLLLGQPVLIGLLINLAQLRPDGLSPIFLFAVVTGIWLGLNNTAREVVRDRAVYVRERLAGATPEGYLLGKVLLYGVVGAIQLLMLLLVVRNLNFLGAGDEADLHAWPLWYMMAVLWPTYLSALLLGLLVSVMANSEETAVATLPLIILPQLLLTGVVTGLESSKTGSFRSLVLLVDKAADSARGLVGWVLELVSLLMYSRPAMAFFQEVRPGQASVSVSTMRLVDGLHLMFLLLATATGLVAAIRWREKGWLERG